MKLLLSFILSAAFVVFSGNSFAEEKAYVAKDNEEFYGTWINVDYGTRAHPYQKIINFPGRYEAYGSANSEIVVERGTFTITDKWTDSKGNIWYKLIWMSDGLKYYELDKISNSGKTWEFVFRPSKYPQKIDSEIASYHIYHRR